ncbi:hypothetical protein JCM24511_05471 [Saitozyma sp. JCM 24511]|nr:hypothetical protein JCM24511_05471 [Saitozyma sp. JCM 24511]
MADEEVDWGVDDSVDVWRGSGTGDVDMGVDEDEDVFDLDGMDAEPEEPPKPTGRDQSPRKSNGASASTSTSIAQAPPASTNAKPPPTGPRKSLTRPTGPKGGEIYLDSITVIPSTEVVPPTTRAEVPKVTSVDHPPIEPEIKEVGQAEQDDNMDRDQTRETKAQDEDQEQERIIITPEQVRTPAHIHVHVHVHVPNHIPGHVHSPTQPSYFPEFFPAHDEPNKRHKRRR